MSGRIDLTGQRFGHWTVIEFSHINKHRNAMWKAQCDCGTIKTVLGNSLREGKSTCCGCSKKLRSIKDLNGKKFGHLSVIRFDHVNDRQLAVWECLCDCGNTTYVTTSSLLSGNSKSCGCIRKEKLREQSYINGYSSERLYNVWKNMCGRCFDQKARGYKNYGGRGITVCDEWRNDYASFRDWAMANGYDPDAPYGQCTIDRIDNDGNYEPSNCRWVSMAVQAKNKRKKCSFSTNLKKVTA